jgi:hypothetical protein
MCNLAATGTTARFGTIWRRRRSDQRRNLSSVLPLQTTAFPATCKDSTRAMMRLGRAFVIAREQVSLAGFYWLGGGSIPTGRAIFPRFQPLSVCQQ